MIEILLLILGVIFLIKGADFLVEGSSALAKKLKVSTLIIGLTVVAFGTSMPELFVSIFAAINGNSGIILGNIIGSNVANILLILGVTALITDLKVQKSTIWKEIPFALLGAAVLFVIANKSFLDNLTMLKIFRSEGIFLLLFFAIFLYYLTISAKKTEQKVEKEEIEIKTLSNTKIFLFIILGLIGLYFGGKFTVSSAVQIASWLGLSDFLISATIIAIGTSLPELVTAIVAATKKEVDIAIGNVVGSNIFNIFWILGITALFSPLTIPQSANFDIIIVLLSTLALFVFMFVGKKHHLTKVEGTIFLLGYIAYIASLIIRG